MQLSLLVPSLECRNDFLQRLLDRLNPQLRPGVELLLDVDRGQSSIGTKRNRLVAKANGRYVAFIDDDDLVSPDYVTCVLDALSCDPDTVGFRLVRFVDGVRKDVAIHSLRFPAWKTVSVKQRAIHIRTPNHLNPTKVELARSVSYLEIDHGEDSDYSMRVRTLLKSECFVDRELYEYYYRSPENRTWEVKHK